MTDHDTTTAKPERAWVWWCNEESIAAGKISVLAIVETAAAVGAWWWLAMHFNWSWFRFIALLAVPLLLLRSEASVAAGVEMLSQYWRRDENSVSTAKKIVLLIFTVLIISGFTFWLASQWTPIHTSSALFWLSAVLGVLAIVFAFAGAGAGAGARVVAVAVVFPFIDLGILLHSQTIRLWVTVVHLPEGFLRLPQNWHETLWVIDLSHPPELIPQAGTVDRHFAVKSLWQDMLAKKEIHDNITAAIAILFFYPPALAYRWSLKASAWLWWPLFLLLKPPFYGMTELDFRERTTLSVKGFEWIALRMLAGLVLLWLLVALVPSLLSYALLIKDWGEVIQKSLALKTPPPFGIRYIALCLFAVLGLWFAKSCNTLKNLHNEWVEKPEQPTDSASEAFVRFQRRAKLAERLRIALIATVWIGVYAFAAMWLHDKNPTYADHFLAPWLLLIL